jgi:hypothetical protein
MSLIEKIVDDVVKVQETILSTIKRYRQISFDVSHWDDLREVKSRIRTHPRQSKEVLDLYRESAVSHCDIIKSLTSTIEPIDEPYMENLQTPTIIELLYELDPGFRRSSDLLVKAIENSQDIIAEEAMKRRAGAYGPTWIVDYVATPGSLLNLFAKILRGIKIDRLHKWTFYTCVSAARITSYCMMFGSKLDGSLKAGGGFQKAIDEEVSILKKMWIEPLKTQEEILSEIGFKSFDAGVYMKKFKKDMEDVVSSAAEKDVHYANIALVPTWGAGDFHHIGQSTYNICKDDMAMAIFEAVSKVLISTLNRGIKDKKIEGHFIPVSDITAAAAAYILRMDGFSSNMVLDLMLKRFYNLSSRRSNPLAEDLIPEFLDFLARGERIVERAPLGCGGKVGKLEIDFSPIIENEVIQSPEKYSFPANPLTARFSSLMKFADDPFHLESDPSLAVLLTNLIALSPDKPILPLSRCKGCSLSRAIPSRCKHCLSGRSI